MATGQSVLNYIEDLFPELQLQSGEGDVTKGLRLVNAAQDYFEILAAGYPGFMGSAVGTVTQTASTESTAFPSGVLRIDRMQFIDPATSRPAWDLTDIKKKGGHAHSYTWLYNVNSTTSTGKPRDYFTDGSNIYWDPLPDTTNTVRYYGFKVATDLTAGGTFLYPDVCMLPFAAFAARVAKGGTDDPTDDLVSLAKDLFTPLIQNLSRFDRDGASGFEYKYTHRT